MSHLSFCSRPLTHNRSGWARSLRSTSVSLVALALSVAGCSGTSGPHEQEWRDDQSNQLPPNGDLPSNMDAEPFHAEPSFFLASTVSQRVGLPLSPPGAILDATKLAKQLAGYDPGSLLRCQVAEQAAYDAAIDALGGVRWGYAVSPLEDLSKPRVQAGFQYYPEVFGAPAANAGDSAAPAVEIALPDIVAVTESAALFYSTSHGLLVVNIADGQPSFKCATQLPGRAEQFFFRNGHLVAMTQTNAGGRSSLLHFTLQGSELRFVERVDLGRVRILDSRRFNDRLVFYTDLQLLDPPVAQAPVNGLPNGGQPSQGWAAPPPLAQPQPEHRSLRVFRLGDVLAEEMHDTLLDTTLPAEQVASQEVTRDTPIDTLVNESRRFGQAMWASDRYFVVTEQVSRTLVSGWRSTTYSTCTASHTVETPYEYCWTEYETRPNPDYTPPDNSGGDRSCQGATLSDCLVSVARVSNQTIQVPVGRSCEERVRHDWTCDAWEQRTAEYPEFRNEQATKIFIYEYTDAGFVRVDSSVHEITTPGLADVNSDAQVATLTTSTESFDLAVPGAVQTLYFQNGYLYVVSEGVLQVYALGGSSIVRPPTLPVVNDTLQSTLFSGDRLYLSDFGWSNTGDHSTLRVVNLANPAFPTVEASTHSLPGGHRSILASTHGILTVGSVAQFQGQAVNAIKLGLFSDPFVEERAYSILATDLQGARLGEEEAQFFDGSGQRLLLPYSGQDAQKHNVIRIGASRVEADQIVSEGAVVVPELPQRVRPFAGTGDNYLSFATSSIEWLTPNEQEWQATPVLEYFLPNAVYRLSDAEDYVEVQRLGNRCRLFFANATDINQRASGSHSEEFDCFGGGATAFANILLFADAGIEFDAGSYEVRALAAEEVAATRARIAERPICLLSLDLMQNVSVDYRSLTEPREVTCMSPQVYQERLDQLLLQRRTP